ncbi:MAG: preprotein translocase subunit SecE [Peptococcaceae bacterium]|mgnify:CR=1 FL=1|nr:preprotein translocase subunit SecE [Peptococcaceae bacterium]
MALTRKQDDGRNKKEQSKKRTSKKRGVGRSLDQDSGAGKNINRQRTGKKDIALVKDKKDATRKESKKDNQAKKEIANQVELVQKFIKGAYGELKKVNWPGRRELVVYTIVVVVAVLFVGALLWIFDSALSTVLRFVINR